MTFSAAWCSPNWGAVLAISTGRPSWPVVPRSNQLRQTDVYPLGESRPPLGVGDLPEPEEVFKVSRLGPVQIVQFVIGPSLIALGISIGSGEWLLGPQAVGAFGFIGIGWVITVSAILQTFYNVEVSRYVVATGEVPIVGWGRVPPGWKFWVPFSLIVFYFAFIFGGWAASAGQGLFALIAGRVHGQRSSSTPGCSRSACCSSSS